MMVNQARTMNFYQMAKIKYICKSQLRGNDDDAVGVKYRNYTSTDSKLRRKKAASDFNSNIRVLVNIKL